MKQELPGFIKQRSAGHERRSIKLTRDEREAFLYREKVEKCVAMFLDLNRELTWAQIAKELKISVPSLHNLTKSELFNEKYNEYFSELGHDPRIKVSQQALADMVPLAVRTLREILIDPEASSAARLKAVEQVFRMAGVESISQKQSDKSELQKFLLDRGVKVDNIDVSIQLSPLQEKARQMLANPPSDVVVGTFVESAAQDPVDEL